MTEALQSALAAHGPDARTIRDLFWVLLIGAAAIFALVMAFAARAAFGRGDRRWLAGRGAVWAGGIAFPVVVLGALLVYTLLAAARMKAAHADVALTVEVVGEQWWWRVHYLDEAGTRDFESANEIRIPVGRSVELRLSTTDVLHSVWIPSLAGKLDMIPGKDNRLVLRADRPGVYRGQCAEYCGTAHAQMALHVVAEEPAAFERWREAQRRPSQAEAHPLFLGRCAVCHAVRGTAAAGRVGPDLTHVGSRLALGAGVLANNGAGALAGWVASNQHLKPGNAMPEFRTFTGEESTSLARYLESLR